ncbi:hypothetical protein AB0A63_29165 [Lentzea sp. NPDC042327]|uniref:hypothetical protein n=1 Tax=Lentzea sp. NPDC042327 TaxID=3154801 RepID=UPI00340B868E
MLSSVRPKLLSPPVLMAAGLGVFGLAGYLFVTLTSRTLVTSEALRATNFYFVVNVVGPGIFFALEQVTSRSVSAAVASGHALRPVVRKTCIGGAALVGVVMAGLLLMSPYLLPNTLYGDWGLFLGVLATPAILAALSIVRGALGGLQRFTGYAVSLMVEGGARIVVVSLLVFGHVSSAWVFGIGYLASSLVAVGAGLLWLRAAPSGGDDRVPGEVPLLTKALAALATASLLAQLLPNLAPLMVSSRLGEGSVVALAFAQAVVVARIPQLAFFPVQTMLLPALTAAVTRGDFAFVKRRIMLTLGAVTAVGLVYSVLFVLVGSWVLRVFMATDTSTLTALVMGLLAFGTVVLIGVFAVQPALVAMGHDRTITIAWAIGTASTFGFALLPGDVPTMAAAAQVVGPALTLLVILVSFFRLSAAAQQRSDAVAAAER